MNFSELIAPYTSNVISYHLLARLLQDYKRPNDKISELLKNGDLISLKKGLYIAGENVKTQKPEPFLIANHLLGPSYVSLDSALSWHGLIPERVYAISSISTKSSRVFINNVGRFEYIRKPAPYYSLGIIQVELNKNQWVMMASPEKALFDKIFTTKGLRFQTEADVINYLSKNLRIEKSKLKLLDVIKMNSWIPFSAKKSSLKVLIKSLENL